MSSNVSYYLIVVSSFLIQLLPIFFISGPAIPDIIVTSIAIIFLYYLIYKKKIYLFKDYVIYYLFIIFLYINFNSLFSEYIYVSFKYSIGFIRVIIFSVALYFILTKNKKLISNFYYIFLGCVIFLFLDSSLQSITGSNILGYKPQDNSRMTSFFLNEQIMGSYVARLLPLAIGLFYIINKNKSLTFFLILTSGAVIFLSGERTSLAYFLITFFCYFLIELNIRKIIIAFVFFFLSISFFIYQNPAQYNRIINHTLQQSKESKYGLYSYRHQLHYASAYSMFKDRPLLGQGIGTFRYLCENEKFSQKNKIIEDGKIYAKKSTNYFYEKLFDEPEKVYFYEMYYLDDLGYRVIVIGRIKPKHIFFFESGEYVLKNQSLYSDFEYENGCNTHPHNIYMQFLAELGIIGFGLFLFIFLYTVCRILILLRLFFFKKKKKNLYKAKFFILLSVFISMFPLFPSGNYFGNSLLILSYLPFGFYLYIKKINDFKLNNNI